MDELKRGGFVFYHSYYDAVKALPREEKLAFIEALMDYAFYDKTPVFDNATKSIAFGLIRANMDVNNRRYDANVANGKKGGAPKGNANAKRKTTQKQPKNKPKSTQEQAKNNPKTTLMNMNMNKNMNKNMNNSYSYSPNTHKSELLIPLDAETSSQEESYSEAYQNWRRKQMHDYGITSVGGDCYQTTIGGECVIIDDNDFRRAFESGLNVNDYVAAQEEV